MAVKTIETKAIISAEDKTGTAFSSVLRKLAGMESAAKATRIHISEDEKAAQQSRREEIKHQREVLNVQREIQHHGIRKYVAQTAATAVAAHSVVDVIRDSYKAGASYQHEVTALQNAGRNADEMVQITKAARDAVQQIPTSTYTENLKVINETTSAFGSLNHAIENLPFMQKSASVLQAASPAGTAIDAADLGNKMARVFEERGTAGKPEVFRREASESMRAMVFSGGKFNPDQFLGFAQQAKSSLQNYNERFLTRIAPSLIGTQGGERAGTAANAFTSIIMGKANDAKQAEEWLKYGLLDKSQAIMKQGHITSWRAGAVKDTNLALQDPLEWAEKVALPAMKAKGVNVDDRLELAKVLGTMFRNQNSNMFANEIMQAQQRARLHKDEGMINQAGTLDQIYDRNLKQDPTQAIKAVTASFDNLFTTMSGPAMQTIASGLTTFAGGLQTISNALKDHPVLAMATGGTLAGGALAGSGYAAYQLAGGFGLASSATALDGSAVLLDAAAARLGAAGGVSAAEGAADRILAGGTAAKAAKAGVGILGLGVGGSIAVLGGAGVALGAGVVLGGQAYKDAHPELFKRNGRNSPAMPAAPEEPMIFVPNPRRGSNGSWMPNPKYNAGGRVPGRFDPPPPLDLMKSQPQKVDVKVDQPPPQKIDVTVNASSQLLQVVDGLRTLQSQLKIHADTSGPGSLGETHTGQ